MIDYVNRRLSGRGWMRVMRVQFHKILENPRYGDDNALAHFRRPKEMNGIGKAGKAATRSCLHIQKSELINKVSGAEHTR